MELRQLRYFLKASELLNFTEAAKAIHISQSTLSQQIKQLEDELGTLLFDRIGKRIALTEAGQQFAVYARHTVTSAESGLQILRDLAGVKTGKLYIGVTYALRSLLTPALIEFATTYPGVYINIRFGTSHELLESLQQAQLDLVLTFQEGERQRFFAYQPLFESGMALVVSSSSDLANRKTVRLNEIHSLPLALPVRGYSTRQFLDRAFMEANLSPAVTIEMNDVPTLLNLVRTGRWHTILSMATVAGQTGLKAIVIEGAAMKRQASLVWLVASYRKQSALRFSELLFKQTQPPSPDESQDQ